MKDNKKFEIILTNELLEVNDFIKTDFGTIDGSEVIFLGITRDNNFDRELPKYTQIGNAVPVKLGKEIGLHFLKILTQ